MIPETIYSTLNADSGVRAYVGEAVSPLQSRIYFRRSPDNPTRPYIVFHSISRSNINTISGIGDMLQGEYQLSCVVDAEASTAETADLMADAVESALEGLGYLSVRLDQYDDETKSFVTIVQWSFLE